MKTHVEFKSNKFSSYNSDAEGVNWEAGIYGKKLSKYLQEKLPDKGIIIENAFAEDWGWCLMIKHEGGFIHFIGCISQEDNNFLCFVEPNKPIIRKFFKKTDVKLNIEKVAKALDTILQEDKDIISIEWFNKNGENS